MTRAAGNRLLGPGYAQALRVFVDGKATWRDVAHRCGVSRAAAQSLCHGFSRQRLIHVVEWFNPPGKGQQWTPVYVFGEGPNAPPPVPVRTSKAPTKFEILGFCHLIQQLQLNAWHAKHVAAETGQCEAAVRRTMRALHALRLICIDDYAIRRNGGHGYPLWTWGVDVEDAKKPRPIPRQQAWTANNAKIRQRRKHAALVHGMVLGVSLDGRRRRAAPVGEGAAA